ncbi:MAG: arginase family protein [Pseudobacteriovorax sp.]|nr:arginase family protein [Pseudobacteriovorax sp.]
MNRINNKRVKIENQIYNYFFKDRDNKSNLKLCELERDSKIYSLVLTLIENSFLVDDSKDEYFEFLQKQTTESVKPSFMQCPKFNDSKSYDYVFIGIPYSSNRKVGVGPHSAPKAIRNRSSQIDVSDSRGTFDNARGVELFKKNKLADIGNVVIHPGESQEQVFNRITKSIDRIRNAGATPVIIGGDHSISYPSIRSFSAIKPYLIHFDAHSDLGDYVPYSGLHHGNFLSRVMQENLISGISSIGVRGITNSKPFKHCIGPDVAIEKIIDILSKEIKPQQPVYMTVDMDSICSSQFPFVLYPESLGLSLKKLTILAKSIAKDFNIVGFDIVEYVDTNDFNGVGSNMVFNLLVDILGANSDV